MTDIGQAGGLTAGQSMAAADLAEVVAEDPWCWMRVVAEEFDNPPIDDGAGRGRQAGACGGGVELSADRAGADLNWHFRVTLREFRDTPADMVLNCQTNIRKRRNCVLCPLNSFKTAPVLNRA